MKHLRATALSLSLCTASHAQVPAGVPQADGAMAYTLDFGTIATKPGGTLTMTLKGVKHRLAIDIGGFKIEDMKSKDGGIMFVTAPNPDGIMMSAYFERVNGVASAADCRNFYFPHALKSPARKENARRKNDGQRALGAYTILENVGDVKVTQENRNIYLFGSGHCADVHLSKVAYQPAKDEAAFDRITQSVALVPVGD
jgi:hypothetical protein